MPICNPGYSESRGRHPTLKIPIPREGPDTDGGGCCKKVFRMYEKRCKMDPAGPYMISLIYNNAIIH